MNNYSTRINSIIDNLQMPDGMNESKEISIFRICIGKK